MSKKLLQVHFAFSGPFGDEMSAQLAELAQSINQEPGFIWKIWTENSATQEAGGIYLFIFEQIYAAGLCDKTRRTPAAIWRAGDVLQDFRRQFTTQPD